MTHVDPFAPADSPQHPANQYRSDKPATQTVRHEAMHPLVALPDEPVWSDDPDAAAVGESRWVEYMLLIKEHGTEGETATWNQHIMANDHQGYVDAVSGPTLAELRNRRDHPTAAKEESNDPASADDDLAKKLAALDEEGL